MTVRSIILIPRRFLHIVLLNSSLFVDFRDRNYFKSPRLSLGARLRLFPVIFLNPVHFCLERFRLPKRAEAQTYISIMIVGIAVHEASFTCLSTYIAGAFGWGACHDSKIHKVVLSVIWISRTCSICSFPSRSGNAWVSGWPIQQFSTERLFAAGNCHDVSGFISVKFPEQMNALLELSLGRHKRWKIKGKWGWGSRMKRSSRTAV